MDRLENEVAQRLACALELAEHARDWILKFYQQDSTQVILKRDGSPVTEADRGAEEIIRNLLAKKYPADGVLGEELGETPSQNGFRWILDPVDGTKSFIHGVPLFGTLIGLEYEKTCVMGVCGFPALNEVVYASKGQGAWWKIGDSPARRARVSSISDMSQATFCTTTMSRWKKIGQQETYEHLLETVGLARGWGDCYGHVLVATGRVEFMVDPALNPWDAAALLPILEEAGGHFIDWKGDATIYGGNGISVNALLKDELISLLGNH